jgi:hypothetical protein
MTDVSLSVRAVQRPCFLVQRVAQIGLSVRCSGRARPLLPVLTVSSRPRPNVPFPPVIKRAYNPSSERSI